MMDVAGFGGVDDPRQAGGDIVGPGGSHDRDGVVVDTRRAVLLESTDVAIVELSRNGVVGTGIALLLSGRINRTNEHVRTLYLINTDGAAAIVTELAALFGRMGHVDADAFLVDIVDRVEKLREQGDLA